MRHPLAARFSCGENWAMFRYMRNLRRLEYFQNSPAIWAKPFAMYYLYIHRRLCLKYDIYIGPNIVGEGFKLVHPGFRRIDRVVKSIGKNCTVLPMVLFGKKTPEMAYGCIEVGDNCYFGTGSIVLGPVKIGNNVIVGAGAVVTKDVPDNCTVAGVPARILATK
jgi:serine O-acetyltransferase